MGRSKVGEGRREEKVGGRRRREHMLQITEWKAFGRRLLNARVKNSRQ